MPEPKESYEDAPRRTHLAAERTQLAWWRTGLTSIAVGIGVGRVVPELADTVDTWPYVAAGIGFALYGVVLFAYGTLRARELERRLGGPHQIDASDSMLIGLTAIGIILGLACVALIIVQ